MATRTTETPWSRLIFALRGGARLHGIEEEETARGLHLLLACVLSGALFQVAVIVPLFVPRKSIAEAVYTLVAAVTLGSLHLLRTGRIRLAARLFLATLWCLIEIFYVASSELVSSASTMLVVIIVNAAWLLGRSSALALAAASLLIALAKTVLQYSGHPVPAYFPGNPASIWASMAGAVMFSLTPLLTVLDSLKQRISALRESEDRNRDLVEHSQDLICTHDLEGRILSVNPRAKKLLGYETSELLRMNISDILAPETRGRFGDYLAEIKKQGQAQGLMVVQPASGEQRIWAYNNTLRTEGVPTPIVRGMARDVTDQKRSEEALRRQAQIIDQVHDSIVTTDLGGFITGWNQGAQTMFGYSAAEVLGRNATLLYPEEEHEYRRRQVIEPLMVKGWIEVEARVVTKYGVRLVVHLSLSLVRDKTGQATGIAGCSVDITEAKRAEEELRAKENLLSQSQRLAHIGSWSLDLTTRRITWTDETHSIYGVSTDTFTPTVESVTELIHPADRHAVQDWFDVAVAGQAAGCVEFRVVRPDGGIRIVSGQCEMVSRTDNRPTRLAGTAQDITERKRAEEELRDSEARYRNLVAALPGAVYSLRIDSTGQRTVPFVSPAISALVGLSAAEIMADVERGFGLIPAEERPRIDESILESQKNLSLWSVQFPIWTAHGEKKWLHGQSLPHAQPDGSTIWHGVLLDITKERRAQDAVRESELRYERLVENVNDAIIVNDIDGRLLFANRHFKEWFGMEGRDIRDVVLEDYVAPQWRHAVRDRHERRVRGDIVPEAFEYEGLRTDGTRLWIEVRVTSVVEDGRIIGSLAALRDITERKRIEEQYRQAQKMETVGQLAGGIAHDFNNLLTVINGYSQRALRLMDSQDPLRDSIAEIMKAGERAAELTRQLLAFSRRQVSEPKALDVNEMLSRSESLIRRMAGENVEVDIVRGQDLGPITADPAQFHQVVLNLVANARDAMPDGGHLIIDTANVDIDATYAAQHVGAKSGSYIKLEVSDTGAGMDEGVQRHVFEPFFTTKETGTGLGLATVHGIVNQHHGWIQVYSELGMGTTFRVYWPRAEQPAAEQPGLVEETTESHLMLGRGTETVLVVEDQPQVRQIAAETLASSGYFVLQAASGNDAISVCQSHAGPIHLLLTDVIMPGMNGRELAERLKRQLPDLRVLFMSGYGETVIAKHGILDAGVHHLVKPFDPESLTAKVRSMLDDELEPARPKDRHAPGR